MNCANFLNVGTVKAEAKDRIGRSVKTLGDVFECLQSHYECKAASRQLDRDQTRLAENASNLSAMAAKYVVDHAKELGVEFVEHRPGVRYAVLKTARHVYVLVQTALDGDGKVANLWYRPFRADLSAWKEMVR